MQVKPNVGLCRSLNVGLCRSNPMQSYVGQTQCRVIQVKPNVGLCRSNPMQGYVSQIQCRVMQVKPSIGLCMSIQGYVGQTQCRVMQVKPNVGLYRSNPMQSYEQDSATSPETSNNDKMGQHSPSAKAKGIIANVGLHFNRPRHSVDNVHIQVLESSVITQNHRRYKHSIVNTRLMYQLKSVAPIWHKCHALLTTPGASPTDLDLKLPTIPLILKAQSEANFTNYEWPWISQFVSILHFHYIIA